MRKGDIVDAGIFLAPSAKNLIERAQLLGQAFGCSYESEPADLPETHDSLGPVCPKKKEFEIRM